MQQDEQRFAMLAFELRIGRDNRLRLGTGELQQIGMDIELRETKPGRPDCWVPSTSPPAAQAQILLGDAKAILRLAHDLDARLGDFAERRFVEKQAGRFGAAATDAPRAIDAIARGRSVPRAR